MKSPSRIGASLVMLIFVVACVQPPTQQVADAESAVNNAIQGWAGEYAPDELASAQASLADVNAKMEAKDYKGALAAALETKSKADAALAAVAAGKEVLQAKVTATLASLKAEVDAVTARVAKVKGMASAELKAAGEGITATYEEAKGLVVNGEFKKAFDSLTSLQDKVADVKAKAEESLKKPAAKGGKK
jgi:hypothetical protein